MIARPGRAALRRAGGAAGAFPRRPWWVLLFVVNLMRPAVRGRRAAALSRTVLDATRYAVANGRETKHLRPGRAGGRLRRRGESGALLSLRGALLVDVAAPFGWSALS